MILQNIMASAVKDPGIEEYGPVLYASDISINSLYWLNPTLAIDLPHITCDKRYVWMVSTDHDSGSGAIVWMKGDKLDLSDYTVGGTIVSEYQSETPWILHIPEAPDTEKTHLYFHTDKHDPENDGYQQTRLWTTAGGAELHLCTWTDRGNPLGSNVAGENHTGYLNLVKRGYGDYIGVHTAVGNQPDKVGEIKSSTTPDGRNFTRYEVIDRFSAVPEGRALVPAFGRYFQYSGRWWWIGMTFSTTNTTPDAMDKHVVLCKATSDLQITELCTVLRENLSSVSAYVEGETAHIYFKEDTEVMQYATYDLKNLQNYL